jgi:Major Facilitator Superfamily
MAQIGILLSVVNAGFAALTMNKELGLTAEMFGFGVGIFFFGYFIFKVPSNPVLERIGARRWIARIMVSWGVISVAFAFVPAIAAMLQSAGLSFFDNVRTFYLMRFIFGAAEAGFFPGIILYLTYWFTGAERARWIGLFMVANPLPSNRLSNRPRRRRRYCIDQLGWQSRRICRSIRHWLDQGCDWRNNFGPRRAGSLFNHVRLGYVSTRP